MSNIIPFNPDSHIVRDDQPPHIDPYSFALLIGVFNDLTACRDSEPDRERAALMRKTATSSTPCWRGLSRHRGPHDGRNDPIP